MTGGLGPAPNGVAVEAAEASMESERGSPRIELFFAIRSVVHAMPCHAMRCDAVQQREDGPHSLSVHTGAAVLSWRGRQLTDMSEGSAHAGCGSAAAGYGAKARFPAQSEVGKYPDHFLCPGESDCIWGCDYRRTG